MSPRGLFVLAKPHLHVARYFHAKFSCEIVGYRAKEVPSSWTDFCIRDFSFHDVFERTQAIPAPPDVLARARRLEEEHGFRITDVLTPDRHMGFGWMTGGLYHRGRFSRLPYEKHVQIVCEAFEAFLAFLRETRPHFACTGQYGSFQGAIVFLACGRLGIPIYSLNGIAYESFYCWSPDRVGTVPGLRERYAISKHEPAPAEGIEIAGPAPDARRVLSETKARGGLGYFLQQAVQLANVHARTALSGEQLSGNVPFLSKLSYLWQLRSNYRREIRRRYPGMQELAARNFVYFPLHAEPESTLNGIEPFFTNQLYALEILTKSIPTDWLLVTKEHPASIGSRPRGWLDLIARFPRMVFAHPFESSIDLIRRARATATITGTAGLEAALLGKPVVTMSPSYRYGFVDHASFADDIPSLREVFDRIDREGDRPSPEARANGARLKRAIEETCFQTERSPFVDEPSEGMVETMAEALAGLVLSRVPRAR